MLDKITGSDDIRANEHSKYDPGRRPPFSYIYEDLSDPHSRILVPGYRYLPVHRETYGYSPRPIYAHQYAHGSKLRPGMYTHERMNIHFFRRNKLYRRKENP